MLKRVGKKIFTILHSKFCLSKSMHKAKNVQLLSYRVLTLVMLNVTLVMLNSFMHHTPPKVYFVNVLPAAFQF